MRPRALAVEARLLCVSTRLLTQGSGELTRCALEARRARQAALEEPCQRAHRRRYPAQVALPGAAQQSAPPGHEAGARGGRHRRPARRAVESRRPVPVPRRPRRRWSRSAACSAVARTSAPRPTRHCSCSGGSPRRTRRSRSWSSCTPRPESRTRATSVVEKRSQKALQAGGATKVELQQAGGAQPLVEPGQRGAAARNQRVEIVFVSPAS